MDRVGICLGKTKPGFESWEQGLILAKAANIKDLWSPSITESVNDTHEDEIHISGMCECGSFMFFQENCHCHFL